MGRLIIDDNDAELEKVITMGMTMDLSSLEKALPGVSDLRDYMCELALRLREIRHHAKFESKEFENDQWVRAAEVLRMIDE